MQIKARNIMSPTPCSLYMPQNNFFPSSPNACKVPRRKCTKYVPSNLQNSPLQCQNSAQNQASCQGGKGGRTMLAGCRQPLP